MANAAFMAKKDLSPELEAVVGKGPMPRTEVTKQLWVYIKANGLQDAQKKTMINPDEKLAAIFKTNDPVSMFQMTKLVSAHIK